MAKAKAKEKESSDDSSVALDDVMIAMDVVDMLRQDEDLVDKELNSEGRRKKLIKRLKDLYESQGIEVSDRMLKEGVAALEDGRFVYSPPKESYMVTLARIYVTRDNWGKKLLVWVGVFAVMFLAWSLLSSKPPKKQGSFLPEATQYKVTNNNNLTSGKRWS